MMKKNFTIEIKKNVNGLAFGVDRDTVRSVLGAEYKEFRKNSFSENTADGYAECNVYYTCDNRFEAIEIFSENEIFVNGVRLPSQADALCEWLKGIDPLASMDTDGCVSSKMSVSIYFHDGKYENVLFAAPGYYKA